MFMPASMYLRKRHHFANPAANLYCHREADATDTIFSDMPVVDGGQKAAQLFVGRDTKLVSIHPMKGTDKEHNLGAFQDCVQWHGAPAELRGDNAAVYEGLKFLKHVQNLYIQL